MSTIGPLWHAGRLEAATLDHLREFLPMYAERARLEAELSKSLPAVQSFAVVSEYDRFPEDKVPAVIVASPGIADEPTRDGEGFWTAVYSLEVSITASGRSGREARLHAEVFSAAIRGAMMQPPFAEQKADVAAWLDEAFDKVPTKNRRTIVAAANVFAVEVRDVFSDRGEPSAEDYAYPLAETVTVEVEQTS